MIPDYIAKHKSVELTKWIMAEMERRHKGHNKAAKKEQIISELFGIDKHDREYNNKERLFRDAIEDGVQQFQSLIVSNESDGYWWAESLSDGLEPAEKKMVRAKTIMSNAKKLVDNLKTTYGGQMGFGL